MTGWIAVDYPITLRQYGQWNSQLCGPTNPRRAENSFVIFVDEIFTTLFEPPFTNVSDAIAPIAAISCLYRAGNGD